MTDLNEFTLLRDHGPAATPPSEHTLANIRTALMTELRAASSLSSPPDTKPIPRSGMTRRAVRFDLRIAVAVAVAVVAGLVFTIGRLGGTESPQAGNGGTPGPINLVHFQTPTLPPELSPVPDGLRAGGLAGEPGWLGRAYGATATGAADFVNVRVSWRGHNPQNIGAESRETTYAGKSAFVWEVESIDGADPSKTRRTAYLSWRSGPDTWTILSGGGHFATEKALRALADTLVPATDELALSIDVAPAGWELAAFKDGVTTLRDPASPDRELTVSLRDGLVERFAEGTEVPADRSTPVTINAERGELLELADGGWMLQALLPDGQAFLLQASSGFTQQQVVEVAQGVHT